MPQRCCGPSACSAFRPERHLLVRILANENVAQPVISELRRRGHDVVWILEESPGSDDRAVLARAQRDGRIVLTNDKDFGELAFAHRLPATSGILLLRTRGSSPEVDNQRAVAALESRSDWAGQFAIIEDDRIRTRPLPASS
jgi:predicted nuclease of predicted toxin-antitoxin system